MYVFAYGSLLDPASLTRTLPDVDLGACVPARLRGFTRGFTLAFRNDGTHPDKHYVDADGHRPPVVLFCDLTRAAGRGVNGVCVPVDARTLELLRARERRYETAEITAQTVPLGRHAPAGAVHVFLGRAPHRAAADVAAGVVSAEYLDSVYAGATHWDAVASGFLAEFTASTAIPAPARVRTLTRIDH